MERLFELKERALQLRTVLRMKYFATPDSMRHEHFKDQCRGATNFAMTIGTTLNRTGSSEAVGSIASVLWEVADWPSSGSVSWEMRRFIRMADCDQTVEFGKILLEMTRNHPEKLKDGVFIDMDFLYWDGPEYIPEVLTELRLTLDRLNNGEEY